MKCLNSSYKLACLQCSFSDKELGEYLQFKKRNSSNVDKKYAIKKMGQQADGTWVLASNVHLSSLGAQISMEDSKYIWIGHVFSGQGVACDGDQCTIELPLTTDPLCTLMESLRVYCKHNFMPCVLTMASAIFTLHYEAMLKKLKSCPVPLAFGESGTGKTTSLLSGLALFGAQNTHFYSKITKEKVLALCSTSGIPLGIDDPQSKGDISRLIIDLFNGARSATMTRGDRKPISTCIIASNFTTIEQQRWGNN